LKHLVRFLQKMVSGSSAVFSTFSGAVVVGLSIKTN
jgi:hypothetical protein